MARLAFLLLILALGASLELSSISRADDGAQEARSATVACWSCEGTGYPDDACWVCRGDGRSACAVCKSARPEPRTRLEDSWVPEAAFRVLDEDIGANLAKLGDPAIPFGPAKGRPKHVDLKPGERRCPTGCVGGKLVLIDEWVPCKVCRNGKFTCGSCKDGGERCRGCSGNGRARAACAACVGAGSLPDGALLEPSACPWCAGREARACGTCDEQSHIEHTCRDCLGSEEIACTGCSGFRVVPCSRCKGRGRHGPQKAKCPSCNGKASARCTRCKQGRQECGTCSNGVERRACHDCGGKREHACHGCGDGAYDAWERAAEVALQVGEPGRARALLQVARLRCEQRYTRPIPALKRIKDDDLHARILRAIEEELHEELERLDALIAASDAR